MKLFEKGKIGNVVVKNRIVMAPMGTPADPDGGYSQRNIDYLVERAKGGAGLIITGATTVTEKYEPRPCNLLNNFHHCDRVGILADRVHMYGTKLCIQISPGIGRLNFTDPFNPPYSASAVSGYTFPDLVCKPLSVADIKYLVQAMGYSALLAKKAGADMVEIHAYGGYLIDQFISSTWNKREDEYGGSLENRMRFLMEIIHEIRRTCGSDFPIIVKITIDDRIEGGRTIEEGMEIVKILDNLPIDMLHIGRGSYFCRYNMVSSVYQDKAFDIDAVAEVKKVVKNVSILCHGKLSDPKVAEKALVEDKTDFIAIGHNFLADPHWVKKVKENRKDEIIPCIGCGECHYGAGVSGKMLTCAVNPLTGFEKEYALEKADRDLNILVVGAGPGGIKAALAAAERGFNVTLWEKKMYVGGELVAAGAPSFKKDVADHVEYMKRELLKSKVNLQLGKTATVEEIKAYNPDFIIVATGSNPIMITVPGYDKEFVKIASDVLVGKENVGEKVVVVGGGLIGCETALELSLQGKDVIIVELLDDILKVAEHFVANDQNLRHLISNSNIKISTSSKLIEILDGCVKFEKDGKIQTVECDSVVFAVGYRSDSTLYDTLEKDGYNVVQVGDNVKPGKVINAIHQAYHAIRIL